ncbi:NPCBM-associated, NEW3 domain of alpha-galactosidase [Pseudooceanicola marinus]|uniref:NPCBM-associated, NEW3 domain of alpha-galactosidase n=1 Tax=Pseudooceanicola marinus TaxID=396013 RepID=A0A1X6YVR8_9RHOB|nr:NEW3 domain-containing protein [Pseudooceanicola marinus]SLN31942.1 NPCBM-associated, NEW3 domain of alpha-galactosidase [Pseudooceanicola marinus]
MSYQSLFMRSASAVAVSAVLGAAAYAAAPEAGSVIGNQAVATYTNSAGDTITVTSNTVETIVQQVAGVTLTSDNNETIAPGGKAFLPHIVTNEGNGPDSFALTAVETDTGTLDTSALVFYPDANMDGIADSATPITSTPALAPGEQFGVVIEASVPSTATGSDTITITSVSALDGAVSATNTDTLTISNGAIVELVKSMVADAASGGNPGIVDAGDTVTITLTYSSTGLQAANNYVVQDILDGNLVYVPGSATWSDAAGALDDDNASTAVDATNGGGETIAWDYDDSQTVNFTLSSVGSGRSGSVTFQAVVASTANAGVITNTATQEVDGAAFPPSNTASITVDNQYAVAVADTAINADGSANPAIASATDDDAANNDIVTESGDVYQGGVIRQEFVLTNLSNEADSLSLDVSNVDFPAGTTFRFVGSDGVTPVIGSIGPLGIGESAKVTLIATLPTDLAPTPTTNYTATITTTSDGSGVTDISTAEFSGAVLAASVDLENSVAGSEGDGASPTSGGSPWVSTATDPGQPVVFDMVVQNEGPVSDSYNLSLAQPLPDGWTVEFRLADGSVVTNTGTIPAGGSQSFQVIVTPTDDAAPGDTLVDIALVSSVSGQGDRIVNQVSVNEIYDVQIIDDQSAQAAPGGIVELLHTITNDGNVAITEGSITESGLSNFSGAIFWDQNGNGVVDASEPVIDNFNDLTDGISAGVNGLAPGESISVIYRVQTPSTSTTGLTEIGTLTLGSSLNAGTATDADTADNAVEDRIVIISGDMTLTKYQYIDANCDGSVGMFTKNRQDVEPGQCIRYMVEAENTGASQATEVTISDAAPAYTTITDCGGACSESLFPAGSTSVVTPSNVSSEHGTVLPGGFARLEFTVRVND